MNYLGTKIEIEKIEYNITSTRDQSQRYIVYDTTPDLIRQDSHALAAAA